MRWPFRLILGWSNLSIPQQLFRGRLSSAERELVRSDREPRNGQSRRRQTQVSSNQSRRKAPDRRDRHTNKKAQQLVGRDEMLRSPSYNHKTIFVPILQRLLRNENVKQLTREFGFKIRIVGQRWFGTDYSHDFGTYHLRFYPICSRLTEWKQLMMLYPASLWGGDLTSVHKVGKSGDLGLYRSWDVRHTVAVDSISRVFTITSD